MPRLIALLLMMGSTLSLSAQSNLDSLLNLLKATSAESEKVNIYSKICWDYLKRDLPDSAAYYADSVQLLATELKDSTGIIRAHYYHGIIARLKTDYPKALSHLNKYLLYYEHKGDSSRVAGALYLIGVVQSHYGNYEKSLAAYYRSLAVEEADSNYYSVGYTLNVIGIILKETAAYQDAIRTFSQALIIFDSLNALSDKTDVLVNLGNTHSMLENFGEAKKYYLQALEIDRATGKTSGIAFSLANLAYLFDKMKQYDSALIYHQEALAIREKLSRPEDLSRSLIGVGRGYLQLKKFEEAKPYLLRALELTRQIGSKPMQRDVHSNLATLYERVGNPQKALAHFKQYEIFKDSILNEETIKKVNELEIRYDVSEKEKQITLLAKEKEIQQMAAQRQSIITKIFIAGFVILFILSTLTIYIFRQRLLLTKKNNEIKEVNLKQQLTELEMKALRSQINPHFLFNCLNSINRMIVKRENENASLYLKKFSKLVRLILENGEANRVSLQNELALIEAYIQLEELRFKGKIGYEIFVDEKIEKENTFLPPMVLQPFVENAIWHGLMHKNVDEQGRIKIAVKEYNEALLCTIEDNGVGRVMSEAFKENNSDKTKSIGIKITEERLRLIGKERLQDLVKIVDLNDTFNVATGTRIEICIPLS
ncbi:tetratricopeptide repeat protein [Chryseolinea sp. H1M3-3]|uniref:tetratricopeptide repeat protein n=1 Tax=Chryseolinea sp. H1M3-3 TaxID=3034144 RepID=UPI0023EBFD1A|nr:tetratricopeptide repeat protein [Chryseolinea sp. H1M3-3]